MKDIHKIILSLVLMAAVLGYTIFNYATGKINATYFIVFAAILGVPFMNMVNILLRELKNK